MRAVSLAGRFVGPGHPALIVAEAGVNHGGSVETALQLTDAAAGAGAEALKLQTFHAERLATADAPKAAYQAARTGAGESQLEMLRRLELSDPDHAAVRDRCRVRGLLFVSTPFDAESADMLEKLGVAALKVGSGDITNLPLLSHVAGKGLPIILSTGMATLDEVKVAVDTIRSRGDVGLILLHCVSNYPADPADANLRAMATMRAAFDLPVGFSDHTPGIGVATAAAALGACVIEKHLTLDRAAAGPDHAASLDPGEFARLVEAVRTVEKALGDGVKRPAASEAETAAVARRSLVAARDLPAGTLLTRSDIAARRPGTGLPPTQLPRIVGRKLRAAVAAGALLRMDMLA